MIIHTRCSIGHAIVSNTRIAMRSIRKLPMYLASPITVTLHFSQSVDTAKVRDSSHLLIYLILPRARTEETAVPPCQGTVNSSSDTTMCAHPSVKRSNHMSCCRNSPLMHQWRRRWWWWRAHWECGLPSHLVVHC